MWKKHKIVMIASDKATFPNCIWVGRISGILILDESYADSPRTIDPIDNSMLPQHIYILSDDNIKEGDWCIKWSGGKYKLQYVNKFKEKLSSELWNEVQYYKVIASTDTALNLPLIPKSFIEEYITQYNDKDMRSINNVMVEYINHTTPSMSGNLPITITVPIPKLTNNTISIKQVKHTWNRNEVISFAQEAMMIGVNSERGNFNFNTAFLELVEDKL